MGPDPFAPSGLAKNAEGGVRVSGGSAMTFLPKIGLGPADSDRWLHYSATIALPPVQTQPPLA
jgi:hypothetical protein